jgi:hypothetical protein
LLLEGGTVYIINWKKGVFERSIELGDMIGLDRFVYCHSIMFLEDNKLLVLIQGGGGAVLNLISMKVESIEIRRGKYFDHITGYKKYLYDTGKTRLINFDDYERLISNKVISLIYKHDEVKHF